MEKGKPFVGITGKAVRSIYFIGICGTAMASVATHLKSQGFQVAGSDENVYPPMDAFLAAHEIVPFQGYDEAHLDPPPDLVVIGNALSRGNPEVERVLERKYPYTSLPDLIRDFFIRGKRSIVIAGTHGKTTISSLLAWILKTAGKDPSFMIGGIPMNLNTGFRIGKGTDFVIEGDEYDTAFFDKTAKFLHYLPDIVVINNIEFDHADIYENLDQVILAFKRLINLIPRNGLLIANGDDPIVKNLIPLAFCPVESYGLGTKYPWLVGNIEHRGEITTFSVTRRGKPWGAFETHLLGNYNVTNALAALVIADHLGIDLPAIQEALKTYQGVKRRLEVRGEVNGITVYDDFAHHPTSVRETLKGLRGRFPDRRIWAVFEPRTNTTRRNIFQEELARAFVPADGIIIAKLDRPHLLKPEERLSTEKLIEDLRCMGKTAHFIPEVDDIVTFLSKNLKGPDLVVILSNGKFGDIHTKLLDRLKCEV
ncbi:UDP-N-acetylmuramate:L-alanyl-gamma-D-glutamyl-meso-diaminopimelate ligase [candidate division KSB1 bacterium]|nr:UDP-N-acetylmuramate:L-alanyl-gamma-D-glutamyl-meso-diaminopimelate ligase [candidate division KSB1 bacterium]